MLRRISQIILLAAVTASPLLAQTTTRMWYRGPFDGWVDVRNDPAPGYYYSPSPNPMVPLHESSYGQPIPCAHCGYYYYPGQDVCPFCGERCPAGADRLSTNTVYSPRQLPGQYYFEEQPHYLFPGALGLRNPLLRYPRGRN
jgi:hypothetical protein